MNDSCYKSPSLFPYPFSGIGSYTVRQILSVQLLALFFIRYSLYRFEIQTKAGFFYSCEQRAKRACLHAHLATAARVKYPAALQRYKFDVPLLAAGYLTRPSYAGDSDASAVIPDLPEEGGTTAE